MTGIRRSRGFTLVESIIVMLVLGLAALGITAMQGRLFTGLDTVDGMQLSTRVMLECAEQVMAQRRHTENGYANVVLANGNGGNLCADVPNVPTVTVVEPFTGPACPTNYTCKTVAITTGGLAAVTVMLVDY
jgi:prepilin-type N-terminal cleavage/methylation domain-containing protein